MRSHFSSTLGVVALAAMVGCSSDKPVKSKPVAAELRPVPDGHPSLTPLPDPDLQDGHVGRAPRRITVAQLRTSISVTTGQEWSQLDKLSPSLGQADYALVSSEATEPNLVFAKFLEDGAREVCLEAAQADLTQTTPGARVLMRELPATIGDQSKLSDETIAANLTYLSTRFWGQPLSADELTTWATAFKGMAARAEVAKKRREAWAAICIAMITDPRFLTY